MNSQHDDPMRGTGRTTGLMLKAIGDACLNIGKKVEFIDHDSMDHKKAIKLGVELFDMATRILKLKIDVSIDGNRIFVVSEVKMEYCENRSGSILSVIPASCTCGRCHKSTVEPAGHHCEENEAIIRTVITHIGLCRHYNDRTADNEGCEFCPSFDSKTCPLRMFLASVSNPKAWEPAL